MEHSNVEDGEVIVTYGHLHENCHHTVGRCGYTLSIMGELQGYAMLCPCGKSPYYQLPPSRALTHDCYAKTLPILCNCVGLV